MNRGTIHRPADVMVLFVCLFATAFVLGMDVQRQTIPEPAQCEPGFVTSTRKPDGTLDCFYERLDWRRPIEKRRVR